MTELELEIRYFWGVAKSATLEGLADEAQDELEVIEMHTESGALRRAARRAIEALAGRGVERASSRPGAVVGLSGELISGRC